MMEEEKIIAKQDFSKNLSKRVKRPTIVVISSIDDTVSLHVNNINQENHDNN